MFLLVHFYPSDVCFNFFVACDNYFLHNSCGKSLIVTVMLIIIILVFMLHTWTWKYICIAWWERKGRQDVIRRLGEFRSISTELDVNWCFWCKLVWICFHLHKCVYTNEVESSTYLYITSMVYTMCHTWYSKTVESIGRNGLYAPSSWMTSISLVSSFWSSLTLYERANEQVRVDACLSNGRIHH